MGYESYIDKRPTNSYNTLCKLSNLKVRIMARGKPEEVIEDAPEDETILLKGINEKQISERVREYFKDFEEESLTTVDRGQIRRLARLEVAADQAAERITDGTPWSPNQSKALSETAGKLSAEARQLADALGMTRKRRVSDDGSDIESYIPKLHRDALKFLNERAVAIVCPHCREEKAHVEIKAGAIIYHFAFEGEWEWKSKCPRCQQWFTINQDNYIDFRFDTLGKYEETKRSEFDLEDEDDSEDAVETEDES